MDSLDIFVRLDSNDATHDVPQPFFHSPKYYVRGDSKPHKALLFQKMHDTDVKEQHLAAVKAAMGRELAEGHYDGTHIKERARRLVDTVDCWDYILQGERSAAIQRLS